MYCSALLRDNLAAMAFHRFHAILTRSDVRCCKGKTAGNLTILQDCRRLQRTNLQSALGRLGIGNINDSHKSLDNV